MSVYNDFEVWFVTGSQHLYGEETLKEVANDSKKIIDHFNSVEGIPARIIFKEVLTTSDAITRLCLDANNEDKCIGLITWMHTFSPAKMWIDGLNTLIKPFAHLHTQFNRDIPWNEIDMDFMNLNQSAHGDREFGFICSRLRLERKVIVGHWKEDNVINKLTVWMRAAAAWQDSRKAKFARFGDNMRNVAVTEGDKVAAQIKFGYSVNGFGVGDLVEYVSAVQDKQINELLEIYEVENIVSKELQKGGEYRSALEYSARIEAGIKNFLDEGDFKGFTTTFEDLHGLKQLPGFAVQRLMLQGYGFGAEGDWKTAALVRAMKVMAKGLKGGTSFMEDYTYHLDPKDSIVLGAHMLEVCPSVADDKPSLEIHPLGIGGKDDPIRQIFSVSPGRSLNASLMDMGNRFRLLINEVETIETKPLPKLPVARVVWKPLPDLRTAAAAWIYAGGAHHTGYSKALTPEYLIDFAEMAGIEYLIINENTDLEEFKKEIRWNDIFYAMKNGYKF